MPQKAVSPLIATVLVIGFAIALSGIMMTWGTSFVKDIQERSEKSSLKDIACTKDVGLNIKSATVLGNKIKLVIENLGQMDMDKLNILLIGSDGGDNIETGTGISAGGIQSFSVALDPNKIGTFKQVEAMPYVTFEGEQIACKDAVDKEGNLGIDTDGLIAYYKLDGDAKDSAGNNNGIINGNPANVNGVFGNALNFDGVDDSITVMDNDIMDFGTNDFSIGMWVKVNGGGSDGIAGKRNNARGYRMDYWGSKFRFLIVGDSGVTIQTDLGIQMGRWYYLFGVADGGTIAIYLDGTKQANTLAYSGSISNTIPFEVGRLDQSNFYAFNGIIDEVKIYNKAKTY
jgi:flagellin-like protein